MNFFFTSTFDKRVKRDFVQKKPKGGTFLTLISRVLEFSVSVRKNVQKQTTKKWGSEIDFIFIRFLHWNEQKTSPENGQFFHIFDNFFSFFKNHLFLGFPQVHTRKMRAKKASKVSVKKYQTSDFDQICRILLKCFESKVSKIESK